MRSRVFVLAVPVVAAAAYAAVAVHGMRTKCAAFDETAHLPAGYAYLTRGDFRLNSEHPPLVKSLAALPLLASPGVRFDPGDAAWALRRQWELGRRFLYAWNDADRLLFLGRLPIVALGAALCVAVFAEALRRHGRAAAAVAVLLAATSPEVLAHGQIVTTDLGIALFLFLSVVAFERLSAGLTWPRLARAGLAVGAAFATKFSAVVLVPVLALLALLRALLPGPLATSLAGSAPRSIETRAGRLAALALALAAVAAVALGVVWACYGFTAELSPDPDVAASFEWQRVEPPGGVAAAAARTVRAAGVLPDPFVFGFLRFFKHSEARPAFLLGRVSDAGFWYFFPVTFLFKTPVGLLLLLALAVATRRSHPLPAYQELAYLVPVAVYAVVTLTRGLNIGHRHLLPLYPFLFVTAGRAAAWAAARPRPLRPALLVAGLAAWAAGSSLGVHPHYLAYFNELAGGPANGYRIAVDSSLDWGQDLKGLRAWADAHPTPRLKLSYFGTADPAYYGVPAQPLPGHTLPPQRDAVWEVRGGDVVAVSATNLQCVYLDAEACRLMERLRRGRPFATVGGSILIYRADFAWTGAPPSPE